MGVSLVFVNSEKKRQLKAEKKAKEKAERLAAQAEKEKEAGGAKSKKKDDYEDIDPNVGLHVSTTKI